MNKGMTKAGLIAILGWMLVGCAGNKMQGGIKDDDPLGRLMNKKSQLAKEGILAEVSTAKSRDLQTVMSKVELECRARLTRAVEAKTSSLQKSFKEEVGEEFLSHFTDVTKSVASATLSGTSLVESPYREKDGEYEMFGLMILDPKTFKDALSSQLKADQAMKTRWLASKGYADLDKETTEYEKFKRENNGGSTQSQPAGAPAPVAGENN
jgi:hypothetical protein